jgi:hypothetical protein
VDGIFQEQIEVAFVGSIHGANKMPSLPLGICFSKSRHSTFGPDFNLIRRGPLPTPSLWLHPERATTGLLGRFRFVSLVGLVLRLFQESFHEPLGEVPLLDGLPRP